MRLDITFSTDFDNWYNNLNSTESGRKLLDIEGISRRCLDVGQMSHSYFTKNFVDVGIDPNANSGEKISPNGYGGEIVKGIQKLEGMYLLHRYAVRRFGLERANELLTSIVKGNIYMHDSSGVGIQQVYCVGISTYNIMTEGRPYGQLQSLPPKRADSFLGQCIELVLDCAQDFAGAVALGDLFINYSWYAKKENLSDERIINDFQKLLFIVNNPFRIGFQSAFTNLSIFDMPNLKKAFEHVVYPDGSSPDFDYIMKVQKLYCEWFSRGDPISHLPFRFPVTTINIMKDEENNIVDTDFLDYISKLNMERGVFNIYVNNGTKVVSCCRLVNSIDMLPKLDSFANGAINLGSVRVITLNLPRIAIQSKGNIDKFYEILDKRLAEICDLHNVHRNDLIKRRIDAGFLKFFKPLGWLKLEKFFSTIGIIGVYEMNRFMGYDLKNTEGIEFTENVLNHIEEKAREIGNAIGCQVNTEEIPGESVAVKFVQKDRVLYGDEKVPFELYSNQYIPLIADASISERIDITGKFQDILSGGGILHLNIAEKITDPNVMKHLIKYSVLKGVSHLAVNYGFGKCEDGHVTICGNSQICPICNKKIKTWACRIVGYMTLVDSWSKVRREFEFPRRVFK